MQQAKTDSNAVQNETIVKRTSDRELVVTRTFNAPARIVFDAWTKPELLKRWWAPKSMGVSLFECEQDFRVGGAYRFAFGRDPRNPEVFSGRYLEVDPPARLVLTQLYERMAHVGDVVVTADFEENEGRTRLTLRQLFPSKEALEGALASGMERGMRITLDQLDELVAPMRLTTPDIDRSSLRGWRQSTIDVTPLDHHTSGTDQNALRNRGSPGRRPPCQSIG